jgi:hypothetical protein
MVLAIPTPVLMTDPGYLVGAILGTTLPTNTVAASVFTDAWPAGWVNLGATEEGSTFSGEINIEAVSVAEFFEPIRYSTTERNISIAWAFADYNLHNIKRAWNGGMGVITPTSGTGATALYDFEPPDPGSELRIMLGWESLDHTLRLVCRQCINGGTIESTMGKAPAKGLIPVTFSLERPVGNKPFKYNAAGDARGGTGT